MDYSINRREFLLGLAGLGASIVLSESAADAEVAVAWAAMLADPWHFEVSDRGTIAEPDPREPKINADVYRFSVDDIRSVEDLIREVDGRYELEIVFENRIADSMHDRLTKLREAVASLESELQTCAGDTERHKLLQGELKRTRALVEAAEEDDPDWKDWVRAEGDVGLPASRQVIADWLEDPVNWDGMEWWDKGWSGQGRALRFFQSMDSELRDALGVAIVEGDRPGSTYLAAELRLSISDANATAKEVGLPFRFREARG